LSLQANLQHLGDVIFRVPSRYDHPRVGDRPRAYRHRGAVGPYLLETPGPRRGGGDVTPLVVADHLSKWYGQVIGLNGRPARRIPARNHRPARPKRRREVDAD